MDGNNLNVGIVGLGTVGLSAIKMIEDNSNIIYQKTGKKINIIGISARNRKKDRGLILDQYQWFDNPFEMLNLKHLDVLIELVGGSEGIALEIINKAFQLNCHVVTANKALVAESGIQLAKTAESNNVLFYFEAAVAGGIPIIKTIRESLCGNSIYSVTGILNGTCNYILSRMANSSMSFSEALNDAKLSGYAEDDPSFDIKGIDTAHKLSILSSLSFGSKPSLKDIYIEGIDDIAIDDFIFAKELGYQIKLLGITGVVQEKGDNKIFQRVYPALVSNKGLFSSVDEARNAVITDSSHAGRSLLDGLGAGGDPTASSVLSDLVDIAKGNKNYPFGIQSEKLKTLECIDIKQRKGSYYIRFKVIDRPGVFASIGQVFNENSISMENILQKNDKESDKKNIVIVTHKIEEVFFIKAIDKLKEKDFVLSNPKFIRIEEV